MSCPDPNEFEEHDYQEPDCMCGDPDCPQCNPWCHTCGGDGYGCRGFDWSNDDPVNEPDGEVERCPNCRGSGLARDCWYW